MHFLKTYVAPIANHIFTGYYSDVSKLSLILFNYSILLQGKLFSKHFNNRRYVSIDCYEMCN